MPINLVSGDHVTVIGRTGCGKTTLVMELVELDIYPYVIIFKNLKTERRKKPGEPLWGKMRNVVVCRSISGVSATLKTAAMLNKHCVIIFDFSKKYPSTPGGLKRAHEDLCYAAMKWGNVTIINDEVTEVCDSHLIGPRHWTLMYQGRGMGVTYIACSQRPSGVNNWVYTQSQHFFWFAISKKEFKGEAKKYIPVECLTMPNYEFTYENNEGNQTHYTSNKIERSEIE